MDRLDPPFSLYQCDHCKEFIPCGEMMVLRDQYLCRKCFARFFPQFRDALLEECGEAEWSWIPYLDVTQEEETWMI